MLTSADEGLLDLKDNEDVGAKRQLVELPAKPKRGQANRRERVRTENVNAGFDKLRKLIPTDPLDRKLSKIEILRLATSYIKHLYNLTRANSCFEANLIDHSSSIDDRERGNHNPVKRAHGHVCTFCLMMTKVAPPKKRR